LEHEAKKLLQLHGAPDARNVLATDADKAVEIAASLGGPVAMKIVSPDILHKTEAGGVALNLKTPGDIRDAFSALIAKARAFAPRGDIRGVLVAPMAQPGLEVIIGTKIDDQFGPVIMYGLGGVMVEILKDVAFRVLPISRWTAQQMIRETKSFPILEGVRGTPPSDQKALINLLLLCSELIESYPEITEMDLNPVIVHESGISIVDARIILRPRPPST
jgi:acetyltransferase